MKPSYLKFTNPHPGDLRRSVWEVVEVFGSGRHEYYSGQLAFATGAREGWWFISSDDSIKWFLGPRVKDAMKELRKRYLKHKR